MREIFTCIVNNVETDYNVTCLPETVETVAGIYGPTLQSTFETRHSLKLCKSYQFAVGVVDYYSELLRSFRHAKYSFECIMCFDKLRRKGPGMCDWSLILEEI